MSLRNMGFKCTAVLLISFGCIFSLLNNGKSSPTAKPKGNKIPLKPVTEFASVQPEFVSRTASTHTVFETASTAPVSNESKRLPNGKQGSQLHVAVDSQRSTNTEFIIKSSLFAEQSTRSSFEKQGTSLENEKSSPVPKIALGDETEELHSPEYEEYDLKTVRSVNPTVPTEELNETREEIPENLHDMHVLVLQKSCLTEELFSNAENTTFPGLSAILNCDFYTAVQINLKTSPFSSIEEAAQAVEKREIMGSQNFKVVKIFLNTRDYFTQYSLLDTKLFQSRGDVIEDKLYYASLVIAGVVGCLSSIAVAAFIIYFYCLKHLKSLDLCDTLSPKPEDIRVTRIPRPKITLQSDNRAFLRAFRGNYNNDQSKNEAGFVEDSPNSVRRSDASNGQGSNRNFVFREMRNYCPRIPSFNIRRGWFPNPDARYRSQRQNYLQNPEDQILGRW